MLWVAFFLLAFCSIDNIESTSCLRLGLACRAWTYSQVPGGRVQAQVIPLQLFFVFDRVSWSYIVQICGSDSRTGWSPLQRAKCFTYHRYRQSVRKTRRRCAQSWFCSDSSHSLSKCVLDRNTHMAFLRLCSLWKFPSHDWSILRERLNHTVQASRLELHWRTLLFVDCLLHTM